MTTTHINRRAFLVGTICVAVAGCVGEADEEENEPAEVLGFPWIRRLYGAEVTRKRGHNHL